MFLFSSMSEVLAPRATFGGAAERTRLIFVSFDSASFDSAATTRLAMSRTNTLSIKQNPKREGGVESHPSQRTVQRTVRDAVPSLHSRACHYWLAGIL